MFNNAGINKVFLVGHVGKAPCLQTEPDGQSFYCFPLATTEYIKKHDNSVEHTEWHHVKVPSQQFSHADSKPDKGTLIYLEGRIKTLAFTDDNGVKRYRSNIVTISFRILGAQNTSNPVYQNHA